MNNLLNFPVTEINAATSSDLDAIAEMVNHNWHETYSSHLPSTLCNERNPRVFRKQLERNLGNSTIARVGHKIVGYTDHVSNCIDNLWVTARYRRHGIATQLMHAQLQLLLDKGMQSAQVGCESFNHAGIGFYEHHGWNVIDETLVTIATGYNIGVIVYGIRLNSKEQL